VDELVFLCQHHHFTTVLDVFITLGMNNRPAGSRSSETQLRPTNIVIIIKYLKQF
jgi:hypothetical protein